VTMRALGVWLARSRPPRARLLRAVGISVLAAASSIALLGGSGLLIGKAAEGGGLAALGVLLVIIEIVAFLRAPLRFEERLITHRVALGSMVRWRTWLYDVISVRLPGSLSPLASGELLDRSIEDVDALEDLYVRIALPVFMAVVTGLLGALLIGIVLPLAGVALGVGVLVGLALAALIARRSSASVDDTAYWRGLGSARTVDLFDGLAELTMAGAADDVVKDINDAESRRARLAARSGQVRGVGIAAEGLIGGLTVIAVALLAADAAHRHVISAAEAAAVALATVAVVEPLLGLVLAAVRAPEVASSARRLDELSDAPVAFHEPTSPLPWPEGAPVLMLDDIASPAVVGGPLVLKDVSLAVAPGERVAILGASGSGKSTICTLIMRFLDPTEGSIEVGGLPIGAMHSDEVRRHVALLDQSPTLFGGTLADTLRLGNPAADDEMLRDVLRLCDLEDLLAKGLNQPLAERGTSLSGGQQRRVALARVLLRKPDLLLLDEPTAGLDPVQGRAVLANCLRASKDAGVILLTHDVEEADQFDRVYWLEDGVLVELSATQRHELAL